MSFVALLVRSRLARQRPCEARELDALEGERFLEAAFLASGRNFAVAAALLPAALRREGQLGFLVRRALDAFEDLAPDRASAAAGIEAATAYLSGRLREPPSTAQLIAADDCDAIEIHIARRLPALETALRALPATGRARVLALAADVARAMQEIDGDRDASSYGARVLGRTARYALELIGMQSAWPIDYGSIGRVAQAANHLRDAEKDSLNPHARTPLAAGERRLGAVLEALEAAPSVACTLATLRSPSLAIARASVVHVAANTARFYTANLRHPCPSWLASPMLVTMLSLLSEKRYLAFCRRLQGLVLQLIVQARVGFAAEAFAHNRVQRDSAFRGRRQLRQEFESWLAMQHPEPERALVLGRVCALARVIMHVGDFLPRESILRQRADAATKSLVLVTDYLLACAIRDVATFGNHVLHEFAELIARCAGRPPGNTAKRDEACEIPIFLATVVGRARGLRGERLSAWVGAQRAHAEYLHWADEGGWLRRRHAASRLVGFCAPVGATVRLGE